MKNAKYLLIVLGILGFLAVIAAVVGSVVARDETPEIVQMDIDEDIPEKDKNLTGDEELAAIVDEEGNGCLLYTNKSGFTGTRELNFSSYYDDLKIESVKMLWLDNSKEYPVTYLKKVVFAEGIRRLESTFQYVTGLQEVWVPESMDFMEDVAFDDCRENVTLYVVKGSYGEKFAKKNNLKYEYQEEEK